MTSVQRLISNLDNRIADADITANDVAPAEHAAFPEPLEREGLGDIEISGAYTGAEDATLEIEITSDTAGSDRRTTAPEFTGVGNGSLEGLTASGAAAQSYTLSLIDTGTDTEAAEFPIEGVKLVAATAGVVGNLLEVQVDASALTYTPTGATTVDSADAGSDTFASDAWSLGGFPLIAGRLDAGTPRVAFGDDPTIYRPYRERRDGRWLHRLTPALVNAVPAGAAIKAVTGARTVVLTDGTTSETYHDIVTAWDLLGQIQASSALAVIEGTASNDRTPGGMASRELALVTDAKITRVEPTGTRYVSDLEGLSAEADAQSQTVTVECTAADSVGKERWAVVGTADGDLGTATTGAAFTSSVLNFTVPPKIPLGGEGLRFQHIETRYQSTEVESQAPICVDQMYTGAKASSRSLTLTYTQRPSGDCECEDTAYTGEVDAGLLGIGSLAESGTEQGSSDFDRTSHDAALQSALDDLAAATENGTVYSVTHKAIIDMDRQQLLAGERYRIAAVSEDGGYVVAQSESGDIELHEPSGGTYSISETIGRDIAEAGSSAVVVGDTVHVDGSDLRVLAIVTGSSADGLYRLDRISAVWTATYLQDEIPGEDRIVLTFDGSLYQYGTDLRNASDGSLHSEITLTSNVTDNQITQMSPDGRLFGQHGSVIVGYAPTTYQERFWVYERSGTTYSEISRIHIGSVQETNPGRTRDSHVSWATRLTASWAFDGEVYSDSGGTHPNTSTFVGEIAPSGRIHLGLTAQVLLNGADVYRMDEGSYTLYDTMSSSAGTEGEGQGERAFFIDGEDVLFLSLPSNDEQGADAGKFIVATDNLVTGSYDEQSVTRSAVDGPLVSVIGRASNEGTTFQRGWVAEFSDQSEAEAWRDGLRGLGTPEANGGTWRARLDLTSQYAEDLDPNGEGLTTSEQYYIGTHQGGTVVPTEFASSAAAQAAIDALADETIHVTSREDEYARAQPVVDYKGEYRPFTAYIETLQEINAYLDDVERIPELEDEFQAAWDAAIADKADVIAENIDGRDPAIRDRYSAEMAAFEDERANYGVAWEDTGASYWWVFSGSGNEVGYLPAFTNVVYHSATRDNSGHPYSTQEFAFVIKVQCPQKLQEGDQIILNLDTGDAAYVVGDRWEIDVVAGASGSFYGGVDGDNLHTWDVRGSASGALGTYTVEHGNESAYDANGLTFTIYRGAIPFSAGDRFTFSIEGGAWRWRFDDDDWAEETGFPDAATTLANGLSARFVAGSAPSFVAGDQYRWAIEQPAAPSHVADSFEDCWTFSAADSAWTATWGEAVDVSVVIVARHTLPVGSTLTVTGTASAEEQFSEERTVGTEPVVIVLDTTAGIDALTVQSSADGGSIGWIFAGDPPGIGGDAEVSMRPAWAMIRSGLNGAVARGRQDNAELRWDYLTAAEAEHLAAIFDHSKSAGDQPLAYVPSLASDQPKLRLVRFADDALALPDLYAWTDDDPVLRDVTVSLTGVLL